MTTPLQGQAVAEQIAHHFPEAIIEATDLAIVVRSDALLPVAQFLHSTPGLDFDYLNNVTAVDYFDYFEVVYHLSSLKHNHSLVLKTRAYGRENPAVPSLSSIWRGAELQEREVYDLMGVSFTGHPNLKRLFLWEGFPGHPLRKDFL
jgi:NADH-quinone oxidoreductase subunit C